MAAVSFILTLTLIKRLPIVGNSNVNKLSTPVNVAKNISANNNSAKNNSALKVLFILLSFSFHGQRQV